MFQHEEKKTLKTQIICIAYKNMFLVLLLH